MSPKTLIGVIGVSEASEAEMQNAFEVGKLLGAMGLDMVCGGLGGVMEEASRGCHQAGGIVLGILPGGEKNAANPFVSFAIPTNLGHSRNTVIAHTADLLIAIGTGYGTLSEIAIALKLGKKVLGLESWTVEGIQACRDLPEIEAALRDFLASTSPP